MTLNLHVSMHKTQEQDIYKKKMNNMGDIRNAWPLYICLPYYSSSSYVSSSFLLLSPLAVNKKQGETHAVPSKCNLCTHGKFHFNEERQ